MSYFLRKKEASFFDPSKEDLCLMAASVFVRAGELFLDVDVDLAKYCPFSGVRLKAGLRGFGDFPNSSFSCILS